MATAYFLRRTHLSFLLLMISRSPAARLAAWLGFAAPVLPATWSSIAGWQMPNPEPGYPHRDAVIDYLAQYEARYQLPIVRPVHVDSVTRDGELFSGAGR